MGLLQTWDEITAATLDSTKTLREDLQDAIWNVTPHETPLLSRLAQAGIQSQSPQWLIDSYADAAANAQLQGIAHTALALTVPTRARNIAQIFYKGGMVSGSERAVAHAGMDDPFVYYEGKHVVEIKRDMELAIVKGSAVTGDTDTANQMNGFFNFLSTNKTTMTSVTMTETVFNDLLQATWGNTSQFPTEVYVPARLKRTISQYATKTTVNVDAEAKKQILTTNQYDSDFGLLTIFLHRNLASGYSMCDLLVIDPNWFATGWLRPLKREVLSRDGDRDRYQMVAEFTTLFRNEKAGMCAAGVQAYIA